MTQTQLHCQVAASQTFRTIKNLGFSIADEPAPRHDPERRRAAQYLNWDRVARRRYRRPVTNRA